MNVNQYDGNETPEFPGSVAGSCSGCSVIISSPHVLEAEGISDILRDAGCCVPRITLSPSDLPASTEDVATDGLILLDACFCGDDMSTLRDLTDSGRRVIVLVGPERDGTFIHEVMRAGAKGCLSCDEEPQRFADCVRMVGDGAVVISSDAAVRMAGVPASPPPDSKPHELTARQRQIAMMVARGASNREIGDALFISEHTVKIQLGQTLEKLGLRNRQLLAAHIANQGMLEDVEVE